MFKKFHLRPLFLNIYSKKYTEPIPGRNNSIRTVFQDTPKLPTHMLAITVFNSSDFKMVTGKTLSGKTVS